MPRSPVGVSVSVSVALLLADEGSVVPAGTVIVAVLLNAPVARGSTVPVAVKVAVPFTRRLTRALMFPDPLAGQLDPADATQVHVAPRSAAGKVSLTVAPVVSLGPALEAMIVYV